jgi:hypothetical protein
LADQIEIINVGHDGVASEETLKELLEVTKKMSKAGGNQTAGQNIKQLMSLYEKSIKTATTELNKFSDAVIVSTDEEKKNTAEVKKNTTAFTENTESVDKSADAFDKATKKVKKIGKTLNDVSSDIKLSQLEQNLNNLITSTVDTTSSLLNSQSRSLRGSLGDFDQSVTSISGMLKNAFMKSVNFALSTLKLLGRGLVMAAGAVYNFMESALFSAKTITDLFSSIPIIGSLLGKITAPVDDAISTFRILSASGVMLGENLFGSLQTAANAGLSLEMFTDVVTRNSESLALFGGNAITGAQRFAQISNIIQRNFMPSLATLGFNIEEVAEYTADYLDLQRRLGRSEKLTDDQLAAGTSRYIEMLNDLSRLTGRQRDEIASSLREQRQDALLNALSRNMNTNQRLALESSTQLIRSVSPELGGAIEELIKTGGVPITDNAKALISVNSNLGEMARGLRDGTVTADEFQAEIRKTAKEQARYADLYGADLALLGTAATGLGGNIMLTRAQFAQFSNSLSDVNKEEKERLERQAVANEGLLTFNRALLTVRNDFLSGLLGGSNGLDRFQKSISGWVNRLFSSRGPLNPTRMEALGNAIGTFVSNISEEGGLLDKSVGAFLGAFSDLTDWMTGFLTRLSEKTEGESLFSFLKTEFSNLFGDITQGKMFGEMKDLAKEIGTGIGEAIIQTLKDNGLVVGAVIGGAIAASMLASAGIKALIAIGVGGVGAAAGGLLSMAKGGITSMGRSIASGATGLFSGGAAGSGLLKNLGRAAPVASVALTGVSMYGTEQDENLSRSQKNVEHSKDVGGLAGALAGMKLGAAGGGAVGLAAGGVGAIPGALVGGLIGGIGGYFAGSAIGGAVGEGVFGEKSPTPTTAAVSPEVTSMSAFSIEMQSFTDSLAQSNENLGNKISQSNMEVAVKIDELIEAIRDSDKSSQMTSLLSTISNTDKDTSEGISKMNTLVEELLVVLRETKEINAKIKKNTGNFAF